MSALIFGFFVLAIVTAMWWQGAEKRRTRRRIKQLEQVAFPAAIPPRLKEIYPHLDDAQTMTVMRGLRDFFAINMLAKEHMVSMPSKAVDAAWHEFILSTRDYQRFCRDILGRFLHHTPAEAMRTPTQAQDGIKLAWQLACLREGIDPSAPARLPLLFAIDAMLAIPGGYKYALNCTPGSNAYCASDIGCGGSSGSSNGRNGDGGDGPGNDGGAHGAHGGGHDGGGASGDGGGGDGGGD